MKSFRLHIAWTRENEKKLDLLMELGLVPAMEQEGRRLAVLGDMTELNSVKKILKEYLPGVRKEVEEIPEQDWNRKWKENFKPIDIGNSFRVLAPWQSDEISHERWNMIINPGQAFGTGTHESTQMLMMLMERHSPAGKNVIDLGCGSGILSIAASMLGASYVAAFDYDELFLVNIKENLTHNRIENVRFSVGDVLKMDSLQADYCLMNIEKHIIKPALKGFDTKNINFPELLLSGLLTVDLSEMQAFLDDLNYSITDKEEKGEWIGLYCQPK